MRLTSVFVGERVEHAERSRPQPEGEPEGRRRLLLCHRQPRLQQLRDFVFLAGLGFQSGEQSDFVPDHIPTPEGFAGRACRRGRRRVSKDNTDRSVHYMVKKKSYAPFSQSISFKAASRATSAASGLPWITAVMMAPSTRMLTAGATFAAALPTDSSTNPRRSSLKRCLCPRTNSLPGWVGSASSTAAFWKGQPRNPGDSK